MYNFFKLILYPQSKQDWGLGLIYLKVWYRVIMARAEHIRQHVSILIFLSSTAFLYYVPFFQRRENQPEGEIDGFDLHAIAWKAKFDKVFLLAYSFI